VRTCLRYVIVTSVIWLGAVAPGWGVDRVDEFNKSRPAIMQLLRNKQPSKRIEALGRLQKLPIADSVRLVCNTLADEDDKVHDAAFRTLLAMNGNQEVCETLLSWAKRAAQRHDDLSLVPALSVLLCSPLPSVERETHELLEKIASSKQGTQPIVMLAEALGRHGQDSDVGPLVRLAGTRIFEQDFAVRRTVVQALINIRKSEAVGGLIEIMQRAHGEAEADAVEYLTHITGQSHGLDSAAWKRWWEQARETFEYPKQLTSPPYRTTKVAATSEYYGLPIFAERLVFVLDTSGSMSGPRIVAAKRELIRAISSLPDYAYFGVVEFNSDVTVWHKQLVQATPQAKKSAVHFVEMQETGSNTASYDALEMAFNFDTEAIYFLSDGAPHGGKITAPVDIVAAITAGNRSRRVSLYTIGIGVGFAGNPLDIFLKTLAAENWGVYRRVDN